MILSDHKKFYSKFIKGHEGKLHFAAHSHHFWPDVTRDAQIQYWDDCSTMSDTKWKKIFEEVIPKTQKHIAGILRLKNHEQIVLAPNTHELTSRLLSHFLGQKEVSILTTTNEFHSWRRQFARLMEFPQVKVTQVDASKVYLDRGTFLHAFKAELSKQPSIAFLSQVFFDSGAVLSVESLENLASALSPNTILVIDGYHGFAAIPTDLSSLEGKIFYLGGGYKYAQGGEGVGFMVVPKGSWRPANTGWFAEYAHLTRPAQAMVGYADNAMAFMGSTQDPSGFYRFNATWDLYKKENISVEAIHNHVLSLQKHFLEELPPQFLSDWNLEPLFAPDLAGQGHFLAFEAPNLARAEELEKKLLATHIMIDRRGPRIRFGFGLYQNETDVEALCLGLRKIAP